MHLFHSPALWIILIAIAKKSFVMAGCKGLGRLANGRVFFRYGGLYATFRCDPGFWMFGHRRSSCAAGKWRRSPPVCVAGGCPVPESSSHVQKRSNNDGSVVTFVCDKGYKLYGSSTIYCDGKKWNSTVPVCEGFDMMSSTKNSFESSSLTSQNNMYKPLPTKQLPEDILTSLQGNTSPNSNFKPSIFPSENLISLVTKERPSVPLRKDIDYPYLHPLADVDKGQALKNELSKESEKNKVHLELSDLLTIKEKVSTDVEATPAVPPGHAQATIGLPPEVVFPASEVARTLSLVPIANLKPTQILSTSNSLLLSSVIAQDKEADMRSTTASNVPVSGNASHPIVTTSTALPLMPFSTTVSEFPTRQEKPTTIAFTHSSTFPISDTPFMTPTASSLQELPSLMGGSSLPSLGHITYYNKTSLASGLKDLNSLANSSLPEIKGIEHHIESGTLEYLSTVPTNSSLNNKVQNASEEVSNTSNFFQNDASKSVVQNNKSPSTEVSPLLQPSKEVPPLIQTYGHSHSATDNSARNVNSSVNSTQTPEASKLASGLFTQHLKSKNSALAPEGNGKASNAIEAEEKATKKRPLCAYPPVPNHGTFLFRTMFKPEPFEFRYYIQYACYPGYTMTYGDVYSFCLGNGTWSGVVPTCLGFDMMSSTKNTFESSSLTLQNNMYKPLPTKQLPEDILTSLQGNTSPNSNFKPSIFSSENLVSLVTKERPSVPLRKDIDYPYLHPLADVDKGQALKNELSKESEKNKVHLELSDLLTIKEKVSTDVEATPAVPPGHAQATIGLPPEVVFPASEVARTLSVVPIANLKPTQILSTSNSLLLSSVIAQDKEADMRSTTASNVPVSGNASHPIVTTSTALPLMPFSTTVSEFPTRQEKPTTIAFTHSSTFPISDTPFMTPTASSLQELPSLMGGSSLPSLGHITYYNKTSLASGLKDLNSLANSSLPEIKGIEHHIESGTLEYLSTVPTNSSLNNKVQNASEEVSNTSNFFQNDASKSVVQNNKSPSTEVSPLLQPSKEVPPLIQTYGHSHSATDNSARNVNSSVNSTQTPEASKLASGLFTQHLKSKNSALAPEGNGKASNAIEAEEKATKKRPLCAYPPVPNHGTFLFRTMFKPEPFEFRYYIQYACYPGYTMTYGDVYSFCLGNGTWSGVVPTCLGFDMMSSTKNSFESSSLTLQNNMYKPLTTKQLPEDILTSLQGNTSPNSDFIPSIFSSETLVSLVMKEKPSVPLRKDIDYPYLHPLADVDKGQALKNELSKESEKNKVHLELSDLLTIKEKVSTDVEATPAVPPGHAQATIGLPPEVVFPANEAARTLSLVPIANLKPTQILSTSNSLLLSSVIAHDKEADMRSTTASNVPVSGNASHPIVTTSTALPLMPFSTTMSEFPTRQEKPTTIAVTHSSTFPISDTPFMTPTASSLQELPSLMGGSSLPSLGHIIYYDKTSQASGLKDLNSLANSSLPEIKGIEHHIESGTLEYLSTVPTNSSLNNKVQSASEEVSNTSNFFQNNASKSVVKNNKSPSTEVSPLLQPSKEVPPLIKTYGHSRSATDNSARNVNSSVNSTQTPEASKLASGLITQHLKSKNSTLAPQRNGKASNAIEAEEKATKKRPLCAYPPVPNHGTFLFRTMFKPEPFEFRYYIQYACYPGYTMTYGDVYSFCLGNGTWSGVIPTCLEFAPCSLNNGGCSQICNPTEKREMTCSCREGFQLLDDERTCRDIDECAMGSHKCHQSCSNTFGSYRCSCWPGFLLEDDERTCNDVDECSINNGGCTHHCANTFGSAMCYCPTGFEVDVDEKSCRDINECLLPIGSVGCPFGCLNSPGSFKCKCAVGYRLSPDSWYCIDINECLETENSDQRCEWKCVNVPGSFLCVCPRGYRISPNRHHCVDECAFQKTGCSHTCANTRGGYRCECPNGYEVSPYSRKTCQPIRAKNNRNYLSG